MKAKEYMDQFPEELLNDDNFESMAARLLEILIEMIKEIKVIADKRKAKSNEAVRAIVREQRKKFDALLNLIKKKYGRTILRSDAFQEFMKTDFCKGQPDLYADMVRNGVF